MRHRSSPRQQQYATRLAFFAPGYCMGAWAPLIPFVKSRLQVDELTLGGLLLCVGIGSLVTMPLASWLAYRFGCRSVVLLTGIVAAVALAALAATPTLALTALTLLVFGAAVGAADCIANVQAVIVERESGRSMMSGFHGCFSLGGLVGASGMAALLFLEMDVVAAALINCGVALVATAVAVPHCLQKVEAPKSSFAVPPLALFLVGAFALIACLAEGAVLDWSGVLLSEGKDLAVEHAGLGYVVFALMMTAGRLSGDFVVAKSGAFAILIAGAFMSGFGLMVTVLAPSWEVALLGFAFVGAGISNLFPVVVSLSAKQKAVPESIAVPAVVTLGYAGILTGPAIIGFAASLVTLQFTFALLAFALCVLALSARMIRD